MTTPPLPVLQRIIAAELPELVDIRHDNLEKKLTEEEWKEYADALLFPTGDEAHSSYSGCRVGCSAPFHIRATAFCKVKGIEIK